MRTKFVSVLYHLGTNADRPLSYGLLRPDPVRAFLQQQVTAIDLQCVAIPGRVNIPDLLPGIFNRRYFDQRREKEFDRALRNALALSVWKSFANASGRAPWWRRNTGHRSGHRFSKRTCTGSTVERK